MHKVDLGQPSYYSREIISEKSSQNPATFFKAVI